MGISSERIPDDPGSIEGTGSRGSATDTADGTWPTLAGGGAGNGDEEEDETEVRPPHPQEPAEGPEMDDRQQVATQEWRDDQPAANVGPVPAGDEENPATVPAHDFDRTKNPGHSHG